MERVNSTTFFNNLNFQQLADWHAQEWKIFRNVVIPAIAGEVSTNCYYSHYLALSSENNEPIFMSADVEYTNHGYYISREVKMVRTYNSELEMDFYMALTEYENTISPNPVLFNGRGSAADVKTKYLDWFPIALEGAHPSYRN